MINRIILIGVLFVVALFLGIFLLGIFDLNPKELKGLRIDPRQVSNVIIFKDSIPYLLNYEQQETVIEILNGASAYSDKIKQAPNLPIEKIEFIYFESPSFIIKPLGMIQNEYLFYIPEWNKNGLIRDRSQGRLKEVLEKSYD